MKEVIEVLIDYMKDFTDLPDDRLYDLARELPVEKFDKGTVLIDQGEVPSKCYFVLKGIVRKYALDEDGNETTYGFYSERENVVVFYDQYRRDESPYSYACLEETIAIVGDLNLQEVDFEKHPEYKEMTRLMVQDKTDKIQEELVSYIKKTPEERVKHIMDNRPELLDRVPQHQLASYLGIKPESLSRIKRRLQAQHLKLVD